MTINTGHTFDPSQSQRITNLMTIINESERAAEYVNDAVKRCGDNLNTLESILTGYAMSVIHAQTGMRETMEQRGNVISAALKGNDLSSNERAELWAELMEIHNWIAKDDQSIGDYADAQRCIRFGTQL